MKTVNGVEIYSTVEEILDRSHCALLVVDVQNDLVRSDGWFPQNGKPVDHIQRVLPNVVELVDAARETDVPIFFIEQTTMPNNASDSKAWLYFKTRDGRTRTDYNMDGSWGQQTVDELKVQPHEIRVRKFRPSAFLGTSLEAMLRARGIESVLVCGTVTQGCVQATVTDASFHDFYTVFAHDCVGSTNEALHENALVFLKSRYDSVDVTAVRRIWTRGNEKGSAHA